VNNYASFVNLLADGSLWSIVHKGLPTTLLSKIICHGYDIVLVALIIINTYLLITKPINKKVFFVFFSICFILGNCQYIYVLSLDRTYPAWLYFPWTTMFDSNGWVLNIEDWLFTPLCTILFYFACVEITSLTKTDYSNSKYIKFSIIMVNIISLVFFAGCTSTMGAVYAYTNMLPGILMSVYVFNEWNTKAYIKLGIFMMVFACTWDFVAVYLLKQFAPYCCWWTYISADSNGVYHHSKALLNIQYYPWAWILKTFPIEITPWLTFSSIPLVYFLLLSITKLELKYRTQHLK